MPLRRRSKVKPASRIPGVSVGEEVETSEGAKKKVCFHIDGKWFFRMVDPGWKVPGRPHKAEVRGQRPDKIPVFGNFKAKAVPERDGTNPLNGEKVTADSWCPDRFQGREALEGRHDEREFHQCRGKEGRSKKEACMNP